MKAREVISKIINMFDLDDDLIVSICSPKGAGQGFMSNVDIETPPPEKYKLIKAENIRENCVILYKNSKFYVNQVFTPVGMGSTKNKILLGITGIFNNICNSTYSDLAETFYVGNDVPIIEVIS